MSIKILAIIYGIITGTILINNPMVINNSEISHLLDSVKSNVYSVKDGVYSVKDHTYSAKSNITKVEVKLKIIDPKKAAEPKAIEKKVVKERLTIEEKYINNLAPLSKTNYLIWVDKKNFNVNIFQAKGFEWRLEKKFPCSIGMSNTPTIEGMFEVGEKGYTFYPKTNPGIQCKYYTQISGNYLFHTVLMDLRGNIVDSRMREQISHGCIRLQVESAIYIYQNIPKRTKIIIIEILKSFSLILLSYMI